MRHVSILAASILLTALIAVPVTADHPEQASTESGTVWTATAGEWMPLPDIFPPGGQMKVMYGDAATGPAEFYFHFPAGYGVPWHFHTPVEKVFADKGTMEFVMRDGRTVSLGEGSFVYFPSKAPHKATCTSSEDCYFYLSSNDAFDIHLVDEDWNVTRSWSAAD